MKLQSMFSTCTLFMDFSADRRNVFVNLRIHILERLLQLNGETRTVQATNNYNNLKIYVYFSEPVLNSSAQILNSLNISQGSLLPASGNNTGNRRFGFVVSWFIDLMYLITYILMSKVLGLSLLILSLWSFDSVSGCKRV